MAWKRHLWSTDLALVTSVRLDDLIIFNFMSHISYMPNLGSLSHPHGLEEAPVVHRPGPGHLPDLIIFNSKSYSPQGGSILENLGTPRVQSDFFQNSTILLLVYPQTQITNSGS